MVRCIFRGKVLEVGGGGRERDVEMYLFVAFKQKINQTYYFLNVLQLFDRGSNFMGLVFQSLCPHPLPHLLPDGTLFSDKLSLTGYSGVLLSSPAKPGSPACVVIIVIREFVNGFCILYQWAQILPYSKQNFLCEHLQRIIQLTKINIK